MYRWAGAFGPDISDKKYHHYPKLLLFSVKLHDVLVGLNWTWAEPTSSCISHRRQIKLYLFLWGSLLPKKVHTLHGAAFTGYICRLIAGPVKHPHLTSCFFGPLIPPAGRCHVRPASVIWSASVVIGLLSSVSRLFYSCSARTRRCERVRNQTHRAQRQRSSQEIKQTYTK